MTRGARGRGALSGARGREVLDGPRSRDVLEGGRSRQVLTGPRGRTTGGVSYPDVFDESVLWLDSKYSVAGEPRVINRGTGGSALDAKYGSVLGLYVYDGVADFRNLTGDSITVPDAANLDITGDISISVDVKATSLVGIRSLVGKRSASSGEWAFRIENGTPVFLWYQGAGFAAAASTAAVPYSEGQRFQLAVTVDADNGAVGSTIKFYTRATSVDSWTQLGSDVITAGVRAPTATTNQVCIGLRAVGLANDPWWGQFYSVKVEDSITTTFSSPVLDIDFANVADYATSFTATTGQTVTVNSTSSDTNDPLLLTHTGENYAYFPGAGTDYLSSPDEASYDAATGDVELIVRAQAPDWSPTVNRVMFCKRTGSPDAAEFQLSLTTLGELLFAVKVSGSGMSYNNRWLTTPLVDGQTYWIRARKVASTGAMTISYAADQPTVPTAWTDLTQSATFTQVGAMENLTTPICIGAIEARDEPWLGAIHYAAWNNGFDGDPLFEFNAATDITDAGATSFTATSGQTVTVARATSGRKTALVTRPVWLFGTDDFLEVADNALLDFGASDSFTAMAVLRDWTETLTFGRLLGKRNATIGWELVQSSTNPGAYYPVATDGVATLSGANATATLTEGTDQTLFVIRDVANDQFYMDGNTVQTTPTTDPTTTGFANDSGFRVGTNGSAAPKYWNGEIVAVAVWRRALTTDEIAAINTYYGTV